MKIKPLRNNLLIQLEEKSDKEIKHSSGLILTKEEKEESIEKGIIVEVGLDSEIKKGQKVLFSKYGFDEIKIDDKSFVIINEDNILATFE